MSGYFKQTPPIGCLGSLAGGQWPLHRANAGGVLSGTVSARARAVRAGSFMVLCVPPGAGPAHRSTAQSADPASLPRDRPATAAAGPGRQSAAVFCLCVRPAQRRCGGGLPAGRERSGRARQRRMSSSDPSQSESTDELARPENTETLSADQTGRANLGRQSSRRAERGLSGRAGLEEMGSARKVKLIEEIEQSRKAA